MAAIHLYNLLSEEKSFLLLYNRYLLYLRGVQSFFFVGNLTAILVQNISFTMDTKWGFGGNLPLFYFILMEKNDFT
jgi:hypothetical protein